MTRKGDTPIEERLESGECELSHFMPAHSEKDMVTHTRQSATRQWIWEDQRLRMLHQSTQRVSHLVRGVEEPDYVVRSTIRIGDREWDYKTGKTPNDLKRVFIERDQAIELYVEGTLIQLSATSNTPKHEQYKAALEKEMESTNNQVIMQLMYNRIKDKKDMLPGQVGTLATSYGGR